MLSIWARITEFSAFGNKVKKRTSAFCMIYFAGLCRLVGRLGNNNARSASGNRKLDYTLGPARDMWQENNEKNPSIGYLQIGVGSPLISD